MSEKVAPSDLQAASELLPEVPPAEALEDLHATEKDAIAAMNSLLPKNIEQYQQAYVDWFQKIRDHQQSGQPISVMEHSAIVFALRSGIDDGLISPEMRLEMQAVLRKSWKNLTGRDVADSQLLDRLPRSVLRDTTTKARLFNQAIYHEGPLGFLGSIKTLAQDYVPDAKDLAYSLMLSSAMFSETGAQALGGMTEGYAVVSTLEYLVHRFIGHASAETAEALKNSGAVGKALWQIRYNHALHHAAFAHDFTEAFGDMDLEGEAAAAAAAKTRAKIEHGISLQDPNVADSARASNLGMNLAKPIQNALQIAPVSATMLFFTHLAAWLLHWHIDPSFDIGYVATSLLTSPSLHDLHPITHGEGAPGIPSALSDWFRNLKAVSRISTHHYVHHASNGQANFNLLLGADYVLGWTPPTVSDLIKMDKLNMLDH